MLGTENWGLVAIGGFASFVGSVCYMWGGTEGFGLYWRRFIGSFIIASSTSIIALLNNTWHWKFLLIYPAMAGGMSLGYGGELIFQKIYKRAVFAVGVCFAGFFGMWATGFTGTGIGIFVMQLLIGSASIYLGVKNPYNSAVVEQYLICQLLTLTIPFWGFIN